MKPKLYVLVGVPASGKSYWANCAKESGLFDEILSSDAIRKELYGDESDQSHNDIVFKTLYQRMRLLLLDGKNVCIDACNINVKTRKHIFNMLRQSPVIDCEVIAEIFAVPEDVIRKRNSERERSVPESVINKFIESFEIPLYTEGFSDIVLSVNKHHRNTTLGSLDEEMKGFNQNNPHHSLDLYDHCNKCFYYLKDKGINDDNLLIAAKYHDIGKLYTGKFNPIKKITQYISHANVGAYKSLFISYKNRNIDKYKVAVYINYHMKFLEHRFSKKSKVEEWNYLLGEFLDNLTLLYEADLYAH